MMSSKYLRVLAFLLVYCCMLVGTGFTYNALITVQNCHGDENQQMHTNEANTAPFTYLVPWHLVILAYHSQYS